MRRVGDQDVHVRLERRAGEPIDLRGDRRGRTTIACAARRSSASRDSSASRRPLSSSCAPRAASARAIASPMPPVAPVSSAVLPAS